MQKIGNEASMFTYYSLAGMAQLAVQEGMVRRMHLRPKQAPAKLTESDVERYDKAQKKRARKAAKRRADR
jgi:hypothetical protein